MRSQPRPQPTQAQTLVPIATHCPVCQHRLWADYNNFRTITTLDAVIRLTLLIRRCPNPDCSRYRLPYRPESEAHFALPHHEFGLDVLAAIGRLRYAEHRSVPEIHLDLTRRGVVLAQRTVSNLLDRYDELRALSCVDPQRLESLLSDQGRIVLALDGLQPDVGHEVLWVLRDCLSGEILLAKSLLSATADDLAALIDELKTALPKSTPITAVVSDGQTSIRHAVARALPGVPHQLCHFHYLREAARPISEADRHAKKVLKKRVRGVRPIERAAEKAQEQGDDQEQAEAEIVKGYCGAVRSALTDDRLPPLGESGLLLHDRLSRISASLDRLIQRLGGDRLPRGLLQLQRLLKRGLEETAELWPQVREAYVWVKRVSVLLKNEAELSSEQLQQGLKRLLSQMRRAAETSEHEAVSRSLKHLIKVSRSYWSGLFACYESEDIPRTNNDLEQAFGSHRYHERRASGRRRASAGLVVMGSVRLISGMATRWRPEARLRLWPSTIKRWRGLRE